MSYVHFESKTYKNVTMIIYESLIYHFCFLKTFFTTYSQIAL